MAIAVAGVETMWENLVEMVNEQYSTPQFKRLMSARFTRDTAAQFSIQMAHYVKNRRDCWGYVQGGAPLDVKKIIWAHEQEELMGDDQAGAPDHYVLALQEGAQVFGLSVADFEETPPSDGAEVCFSAWHALAKNTPWLEAIAASAVLEMRNSDEFVRGGAMSRQIGEKWAAEIGIPLKKQVNHAVHVEADVEHAHLLLAIARKHAQAPEAQGAILRGARRSLVIDRVFRGHLADLVEGRI